MTLTAYRTPAATQVAGGPLVEGDRGAAGLGVLSIAVGLLRRTAGAARRDGVEIERAAPDATVLALENARLEAELQAATHELRRSRARVATAAAAERQRLERELHDRAQNRLVALRIRLGLAQERAEETESALASLLAELGDQAEEVLEELRHIARGTYPPLLATFGLAGALHAEARSSAVAVRIIAGPVGPGTPAVELAVYLCCLEAMQNAAKHAGRNVQVTVYLSRDADELTFSVEDDGCGFDPAAADGSGLDGMRNRIASLGGRLEVSSIRGGGTTVAGAVPWPPRAENSALGE